MSQPFVFPPPPPPPPRKVPPHTSSAPSYSQPSRGNQRGRGEFRGNQSWRGSGHGANGRGRGSGFGGGGSRGSYRASPRPMNAVNTREAYGQTQSQEHTAIQNSSSSTSNQKRPYTSAFPSSNPMQNSRPRAPPAVPSFNMDIENLLKKPESATTPKPTVARKSNMLGLTPASYESEPESDDEDDEAKLAGTLAGDTISFEHRGQKMSLGSPAEIAAWIAERRSKYPTQVKADAAKREAEEKMRQWEERKKANQETAKLRREERERERNEKEKKKLREKLIAAQIQKSKAAVADAKIDPTEKAALKADRLRKRAERAAQQLREAEAALEKAQARRGGLAQENMTKAPSDLDGPSLPLVPSKIADLGLSDDSDLDSDLDSSTNMEDTSSSGSSDSEGSDSAPEESSSKRDGPERVPPPKRMMENNQPLVCRNLLKTGRCKFGKKCRYSHEVPSRKDNKSKPKSSSIPTRRKGLYQMMVEKEHEDENKRALRAIIALGEQGLLTSEDTTHRSDSK